MKNLNPQFVSCSKCDWTGKVLELVQKPVGANPTWRYGHFHTQTVGICPVCNSENHLCFEGQVGFLKSAC
jgi:hypothetical protein